MYEVCLVGVSSSCSFFQLEFLPVGVSSSWNLSLLQLQFALTDDADASSPVWLESARETGATPLSGTLEFISAEDQYFRGLLSVKTVADGKRQVDLWNYHVA